jgi:3-oxoacyl-[acyl-carrier protein] reductase
MKLEGKIAVVTGASRGIGKSIATRLASEGATVAINYLENATAAEEVVSDLRQKGYKAKAFCADVSKYDQCEKLISAVVSEFGHIDILASNAGIEHFGKLADITEQDFQRVFSVNVGGQLFMTKAVAPHLPNGGRIVLTSSVSAQVAVYNHSLYAASKAAVSAMVLNLAPELGERNITINAIAPGGTATDMAKENAKFYVHPALQQFPQEAVMKSMNALQRLAKPEEIAATVAFLVSDDASYITGSTIHLDGGWI